MAPVKVIVQSIPIARFNYHHSIHLQANCKDTQNCSTADKVALEQLLSVYGPSKCDYLYSNEIDAKIASYEAENFAHMTFQNADDAARACEAANNHEIQIHNRILTLTAVSDISPGIEGLDDNCLIEIFSKLGAKEKIAVEQVCKRWEKLALTSWSTTRVLDLFDLSYTEEETEQFLVRCGSHLDEILCEIKSLQSFRSLVYKYCKNLKTAWLDLRELSDDDLSQMATMLAELKNFVSLSLTGGTNSAEFGFLKNLPESMEKIFIVIECYNDPPYFFDLSKFRNLRSLTLLGYDTTFPGFLSGVGDMSNLECLDIRDCSTHERYIAAIRNLTKLRTLKIGRCYTDDNTLINIIMKNRELECLDVSWISTLTDSTIAYASALPRLKILNVGHCPHVTLNSIDEMPLLEELNCNECHEVTNQPLIKVIQSAPNLRDLSIINCRTSPELCEIANAAVKERNNGVILEFITAMRKEDTNHENLSPLLKIWWQKDVKYYPVR